jgi:hypothetical protein
VELAVGSSPGRSDVVPFRKADVIDGMYVMGRLALTPSTTVYVTATVTNNVGRYVIVTSEAVAISLEPYLQVSDIINIPFSHVCNKAHLSLSIKHFF